VPGDCAANDDTSISLEDATLLLDEIKRLHDALAACEGRLAELDRLANSDTLVGLANRRSFLLKLKRLITAREQFDVPGAVIFADVDGLKSINDRFGHSTGDTALVEISRLLVASVRSTDCVARLAGDEFSILLHQADELSAWQLAERVAAAVDEHSLLVGHVRVPLSVAVGVAVIEPGDTPEAVLNRADREMYRIKAGTPHARRT
jgi:diguanylate cyclase (GGDEF)-like protein